MNLSKLGWVVSLIGVCLLLAGTLLLPGLAWAQGATAAQSAGQATPLATGAGVLKKAVFSSLSTQDSNADAANYFDVFDVPLTTAGAGTQCVLVHYSGEVSLTGSPEAGVSGHFRTLLDGVVMEGQGAGGISVSPDSNSSGKFEVVGFHHWKCGVAAGAHTIQVKIKAHSHGLDNVRESAFPHRAV